MSICRGTIIKGLWFQQLSFSLSEKSFVVGCSKLKQVARARGNAWEFSTNDVWNIDVNDSDPVSLERVS